ncbi:MAG: hypothetical protein ACYTGZ_18615 [Planctomycetota bacterium]|jgi:hypothetical protein
MRRSVAGVLLWVVALRGVVCADDFDTQYAEQKTAIAKELESFAGWSAKQSLRGFRDRAYEALLRFDPDHKKARRTLKYRWNKKTSEWVRMGKYKQPEDRDSERKEEATARWQELNDGFAHAVLKLLESAEIPRAKRAQVVLDVLAVAPDHVGARKANGETRVGDGWLLAETVAGRERLREIQAAAREALAKAPQPRSMPLTDEDKKFGVPFPDAWAGRNWRGVGNVPEEELKAIVRMMDAAHPLHYALFGGDERGASGLGFYLLAGGKKAAEKALRKHPAYTPKERAYVLDLDGSWIPGRIAYLTWVEKPRMRRDIMARQATALYLRHRFGLKVAQGWAWEGIGLYCNYLLAGTRLTTSAMRTGYMEDPKALVAQGRGDKFAKTDWVGLAERLFESKKPPDLRLITQKDVNTLTSDDLLVSYAMVSYLIECRPKEAVAFLTAYGKDVPIDDAMVAHLDLDLHRFEQRLRRWMKERR